MPQHMPMCDRQVRPKKSDKTKSRQYDNVERSQRRLSRSPVLAGDIVCEIPYSPPVTEVEIALVLSMLADQIDAILQGDESTGGSV